MTYFYCLKSDIYGPLLMRKTPFLTRKASISEQKIPCLHLFLLSLYLHTHPVTLLLEMFGDGYMGRPHLKFWEGPSPISFRPWLLHIANKFDDRHNSGDNETLRLYCEKQ